MTRTIRGSIVIDNLDRGIVVFVYGSRLSLSVRQFVKHESQVFGDLRGSICCYELGFRGALRTNGLCTRTISHDTTSQATSVPCSRPTLTQFVGVGCIDVSDQLSKMGRRRNDGQQVIERHRIIRHFRECLDRLRAPTHDPPILSLTEVDRQMLEGLVMQSIGCGRNLREGRHCVANISE